ncbi:nuclear exosome regulator NRDE2 isoform X1 [Diorhabda sublineata]|uniref:nuclear exosome regulator NRDE2 isoform X1 n=2 Tax=Diorhabda sublineata TaxID=1163346 RepID=UPI0024E0568B|nr:nuclear exosome regulator NRDE2 isoform X1 [Diorhabda sublineata]
MSLFPAYTSAIPIDSTSNTNDNESWLKNSSFQIDLPNVSENTTEKQNKEKAENIAKLTQKKRKHSNSKKREINADLISSDGDLFHTDSGGARELLTVKTISRPSAPIYDSKYWIDDPKFKKPRSMKSKFKRYHQYRESNSDVEVKITSKNLNDVDFTPRDEHFIGFKHEEELSSKTGFYNKHLADNPHDIKKWLEYINFQDTIHLFEKSYRKGSVAKGQRVLAERKLSILHKALALNPISESLQRERLNIAVSTFPADELQNYLRDAVEKDKSNIILWQGYIESTQCSMSHCNAPVVLDLYTKCLSVLHQLRRASSVERHTLEECILKMLYQCGLFLKQAGLFEQLWTVLKMYLQLNLSPNDNNQFNLSSGCSETQLMELEDVIFTSNLPLHELWLRTEKLREACHWLPYLNDEKYEDPQRMVFSEDVALLIHPITMPENIFKLAATVFSLLKIPLLPCRHTTMGELGLDYVPWNLDSIEPLLAIFFALYHVETPRNLWNNVRLAVGPQYLNKIPGHEEYLMFVITIMERTVKCLTGDDKISCTIWFFKFQRLLVILDKLKLFTMTDTLKKCFKKNFKDFLKLEENRQNEIYYLEYALLELEFGNVEGCIKIIRASLNFNVELCTTNISSRQKNWCCLYRHLVEIYVRRGKKDEEVIKLLCEMSLQEDTTFNEETLCRAKTRFQTVTQNLIKGVQTKLKCRDHFLPDFFTDWLMCNSWFIYFNENPTQCFVFLENVLQTLEDNSEILWQKEIINEFYVALLFQYYSTNPSVVILNRLDTVLHKAIEIYPNNLFLLSILDKREMKQNTLGLRWWKVKKMLLKPDRAISSLFSIIIVNRKMENFQEICDTITGNKCEVYTGLKNCMMSLFKKITTNTNSRKCGLIWRLYLQFVYVNFSPEICRNVYYSAVEECPWLKALYMDAAIYIPAELTQIQDLIIEKQLRLHVTPEELDVLRG